MYCEFAGIWVWTALCYSDFRQHRDQEPVHTKSLSSQSYEDDEAFYSPGYHQVNINYQYQAISSPNLANPSCPPQANGVSSSNRSPSKRKIPPKTLPKPNRRHTIAVDEAVVNTLGNDFNDAKKKSNEDTDIWDTGRNQSSAAYHPLTNRTQSSEQLDSNKQTSKTPPQMNKSGIGFITGYSKPKVWKHSKRGNAESSGILRVSAIDPPSYKSADSLVQTFGSKQPKTWRPVPAPRSFSSLASRWFIPTNARTTTPSHSPNYRFYLRLSGFTN